MNAYRSYRSTEMHMYINNLEDFSNENNNVVFCSKMRSRVYECNQKYAEKIRNYVRYYFVVNLSRKCLRVENESLFQKRKNIGFRSLLY